MDANLLLVVYAALFVGVLLLVEGAVQFLMDLRQKPEQAINRRLRMLATGADPEEVLRLLRRQIRQQRSSLQVLNALPKLLTQAGLSISPEVAMAGIAVFAAALTLALGTMLPWHLAIALGCGLGVLGPLWLLSMRRKARIDAIMRQLPDAIDLMVRSLRAGHPLNGAIAVVAREMPDPLGTEAGIVADEIAYGLPLTEAVENMSNRVGLEDLHYMAVAIKIQHGTGGNLSEILSSLSKVIRARFAMKRKIKAISAEGRISAVFLSSAPPALAGVISLIAPDYFGEVYEDPLFMPMVYVVVGLMTLNIVVMRRLVNFRF
jgi:tight adherence protein B